MPSMDRRWLEQRVFSDCRLLLRDGPCSVCLLLGRSRFRRGAQLGLRKRGAAAVNAVPAAAPSHDRRPSVCGRVRSEQGDVHRFPSRSIACQLQRVAICGSFTGCTDAPNPKGESGRPWCYVESQLLAGGSPSWNYCTPVVDYDALRKEASRALPKQVNDVRGFVSKLGKAQRAAEVALDMSVACIQT